MATSTDVPIYTTTLTGAASTVNIDVSAYQNYTNLKIVYSAQSSGGNAVVGMRFNGDSGSNYSATYGYGIGSGSGDAGRESNQNAMSAGDIPSSGSGLFSVNTIYLNNYSNTNMNKTGIMRHNSPGVVTVMSVGLWRSSAAITSISLIGTFNTGSTFSVYGIGTASPAKATGGAIYSDSNYWYHVFTSTAAFTPTQSLTADILVVAGGGGGGGYCGGGGGAGGLLGFTSQALTVQSYTCTVGAGGAGAASSSVKGTNGGLSQFGSLTASVGGGGGGSNNSSPNTNGVAGGSGGGGAGTGGPVGTGGTATSGQGYAGGISFNVGGQYGSGGGGGAGAAGADGTASSGGVGGVGSSTYSAWGLVTSTGQNVSGTIYYAGGGAGANYASGTVAGGYGGGGLASAPGTLSIAGAVNTGGGGGGGSTSTSGADDGGSGGSGIVIVRYAK